MYNVFIGLCGVLVDIHETLYSGDVVVVCMAITDPADDNAVLGTTDDLGTGHECPECGATVLNGQGLYSCFECEFTPTSAGLGEESIVDRSALRL
jgi:hypothetical protein